MCAEKLAANPEHYTKATDPVTKARADRVSAFIYALEARAFYFETELYDELLRRAVNGAVRAREGLQKVEW